MAGNGPNFLKRMISMYREPEKYPTGLKTYMELRYENEIV